MSWDLSSLSRGVRPYILLGLLSVALYLPGIAALPVLDRDEARFAQATRQMLETGDFLRIRFLAEARNKKPAGIYWLQAASVAAVSDAESSAIWPYRIPSLVGGIAAVLLTFGLGQGLVGRREALIGAGLLAATLELVGRGAYRQDRRGAVGGGGGGARRARPDLSRDARGPGDPVALAAPVLAGAGRGDPGQGPRRAGAVGPHHAGGVRRRPRRALAQGFARVVGRAVAAGRRRTVALRDQSRHRRRFPPRVRRTRSVRQADRRRGGAWRAAADASPDPDGGILAGDVFPRPHRRARVARAPRRRGALPHRVGGPILDPDRVGADQAAAISAAGVSGAGADGGPGAARRRSEVAPLRPAVRGDLGHRRAVPDGGPDRNTGTVRRRPRSGRHRRGYRAGDSRGRAVVDARAGGRDLLQPRDLHPARAVRGAAARPVVPLKRNRGAGP